MRNLLLMAVVFLCCVDGFGYTPNDAAKTILTDGSYADTTNAMEYVVAKAQDGWVMTVGSAGGAYTWTNTAILSCTNLFTIQGASSANRPTITFGAGSVSYAFGIYLTAGQFPHHTTIRDLILTDVSGGPNTAGININGDGLCFRVSNVLFTNLSHANENVLIGGFNSDTNMGPFGLFDHCQIQSSGSSLYGFFQRQNGNPGNGNGTFSASWNYPMTWGTSNAVYVEDCQFDASSFNAGTPAIDGASGARWVMRHCDSTNYVPVTAHGPDSAGISNSTLQVEFYYNTNTVDNSQGQDFVCYIRGGCFYAWSNTVYTISGGFRNAFVKLSVDCATSGWSSEGCPQQYTYPANYPVFQQCGQGVVANGVQGSIPINIWSNSYPGTSFNIATVELAASQFLVQNRDWFLDTQGPATNYTPYVYPHPLTLAAVSDPAITIQPQSQSVLVGNTATFTVTATTGSAPLSYQWSKNGSTIAGATQSAYTTPATTCPDNGSTFYVQVCNSTNNCVTSANATLTVTGCGSSPSASGTVNAVHAYVGSMHGP